MSNSKSTKRIKIVSTVLIFSAIALQIWQLISPLPAFLQSISSVTQVVLTIHAIEGIAGAILIALYRWRTREKPLQLGNRLLVDHLPQNTPLAILKAGLYAFFIGTVGLLEIVNSTKKEPV